MKYLPLLCAILIILAGCHGGGAKSDRYTAFDSIIDNSKPIAFGEDEDIYVFCGLENRSILEPLIKSSLEREIHLVHPEKYFNLIFADIKDAENLTRYKNLLFLGSLEGSDPVSRYMQQAISKDLQNRTQQSGADILVSKNRFTRDQIIIHALALNDARLQELVQKQASRLFSLFLQRYTQRLALHAYQSKVIPSDFFKPYPFSLKVPNTYILYSNDKEGRFLSLLYRAKKENREIPDKFLSVYYEHMDENLVNEDWLTKERKRIGKTYFDGDSLNVETLVSEKFDFAGFDGFRLSGAWINPKRYVGGAFQSYGFYDAKTKKAWLIDTMVFFPAGNKLPSLMELFMIASSFKTK